MNVEAISGFETAGLTLPQAAQAVDNRDGRRTGESPRCREERIYQARTASAGVSEGEHSVRQVVYPRPSRQKKFPASVACSFFESHLW